MSHSSSDRRRGWHWSEYWRGGRDEVMTVGTPEGTATFDTGPFWRTWFASFPDGARLLDLATGSGRVAGYALEAARAGTRTFDITGIDYAEAPRPLDGCTLLGEVALERLPFAAACFDGASSQFGLEYADPHRALAELSRVLRPGGRVLMLAHHADSAIRRQTAAQLAAWERVVGSGGALRQARRVFSAHLRGAPEAARAAAESGLREAVARAAARLEPDPAFAPARYFVDYLTDLAGRSSAYDPASALACLEGVEAGNAAWRQRQICQLRAALDPAGLDAFITRAETVGLKCLERGHERDADGALIGWRIALQKA